jgi:hypothetical protein
MPRLCSAQINSSGSQLEFYVACFGLFAVPPACAAYRSFKRMHS